MSGIKFFDPFHIVHKDNFLFLHHIPGTVHSLNNIAEKVQYARKRQKKAALFREQNGSKGNVLQLPGVITDFAVHHGDFAVEILIQQHDVGGISGFDLADALKSQSIGG